MCQEHSSGLGGRPYRKLTLKKRHYDGIFDVTVTEKTRHFHAKIGPKPLDFCPGLQVHFSMDGGGERKSLIIHQVPEKPKRLRRNWCKVEYY